eukprot:6728246-Prymnesium_polylepis.1
MCCVSLLPHGAALINLYTTYVDISRVGSRRSRFWKRTSIAQTRGVVLFTSGCHTVNAFLIDTKSVSATLPGARSGLRMLHAEPWVVGQGDVERADGS